MEFNVALELYERDLAEVVKLWQGLRDVYIRALKTGGGPAGQKAAEKWLGDLTPAAGIGSVKDIAARLQKPGKKIDEVDSALIKIVNSKLEAQKAKETETVIGRKEAAARKEQERGEKKLYPGVVYGSAART
jgi:hypothetical protein